MKRKNVVIVLTIALLIGLMGSCDALFVNQFQQAGLGQIAPAALADEDASTLIEQSGVETGTVSQSFIDAALSDDATTAEVLATLEDAAGADGATAEVVQGANVLIVEIMLQSSGADQMVDNLTNVISVATAEDFDPATDMDSVIDALIPADVQEDEAAFVEMIDALAGLQGNLNDIAASLDEGDGEFAADGVDAGTLAQTALMVTLLNTFEPVGDQTVGEALWAALADPDNFDTYLTTPADSIDNLDSNTTLATLFGAAGMDLSSLFSGGGA